MSKRSGKRIQEKDFSSSKKIKLTQKKENDSVNFDAINIDIENTSRFGY